MGSSRARARHRRQPNTATKDGHGMQTENMSTLTAAPPVKGNAGPRSTHAAASVRASQVDRPHVCQERPSCSCRRAAREGSGHTGAAGQSTCAEPSDRSWREAPALPRGTVGPGATREEVTRCGGRLPGATFSARCEVITEYGEESLKPVVIVRGLKDQEVVLPAHSAQEQAPGNAVSKSACFSGAPSSCSHGTHRVLGWTLWSPEGRGGVDKGPQRGGEHPLSILGTEPGVWAVAWVSVDHR